MIRLRGPDGVLNVFPDGTSELAIRQAMARHYGAAWAFEYGGDIATRTNANLVALQAAIEYARDHPHDLTNTIRVPGAVANFVQNSVQTPLAAGVDQITHPLVNAFNGAFHSRYDYQGISDLLLTALGAIMPTAMEEGAAAINRGDARDLPRASGSRDTPFPNNLIHPRLFVTDGRKVALSSAPSSGPSVSREGVDLTLGQRLGGHARTLEARAARLPFVGPKIEKAQQKSLESFNRAVASRALAEVDASLPDGVEPGHDTAAYVRSKIHEMVRGMTVWPDSVYDADRETPPGAPSSLPPDLQKVYRLMTDRIMAAPALRDDEDEREFDGYSGREVLEILSKLATLADEYRYHGDSSSDMGDEFDKFSDKVRALSYRQQPNYIDNVVKADQSNELRHLILSASDLSGSDNGVYTPANLMAAIASRYSGDGENLVSPAVADLYHFADRASQAIEGRSQDGGYSIRQVVDPILAGATPRSRFVSASNAFDAAPVAPAMARVPSFLGNALQIDPMTARTVIPSASIFAQGILGSPRTTADGNDPASRGAGIFPKADGKFFWPWDASQSFETPR